MSGMIDISGLDKAAVLATLFNASAPAGMGFLQAGNGPTVMDIDYAQQLIGHGTSPDPGSHFARDLYFDYLYGRPLKINLSGDELDPYGFDRDNGGDGTAKRLIDALRTTEVVDNDTVNTTDHEEARKALLIERTDDAMTLANTDSKVSVIDGMPTWELGGSDLGAMLEQAVDREVVRHGI